MHLFSFTRMNYTVELRFGHDFVNCYGPSKSTNGRLTEKNPPTCMVQLSPKFHHRRYHKPSYYLEIAASWLLHEMRPS